MDLVNHPELASDPSVAFRIAGWYWTTRDLNPLADQQNFDRITYLLNGGYNGKASRDAYYAKAREVLGV